MRRATAILLSVMAAGVIARIGVMLHFRGDLQTDPDAYVAHARMLADGFGFAGPHTGQPTAFRPPVMSVLFAGPLLLRLSPATATIVLQMICGVLTIWLVARLAAAFGCGRTEVIAAAAGVACDPLLLRYSALPMSEVISALLLTLGLLCWKQAAPVNNAVSADGFAGRATPWHAVASGVVFSLLAMIRPVALVVLAFLTAASLWNAWREPERRREIVRSAIVAGLACAAVLSPWVIRNAVQFGAFIPATTHGGYTFALANNPVYYREVIAGENAAWRGGSLAEWQDELRQRARQEGVAAGDEVAADRWMYRQGLSAVRAQPDLFLRACLYRLSRFWAVAPAVTPGVDPAGDRAAEETSGGPVTEVSRSAGLATLLVSVWYSLLWVGAAVSGVATIWSRRFRDLSPLWFTVAAFLTVHSLYWTDTRMRAPLMPILVVLSVIGWREILRWTHGRTSDSVATGTGHADAGRETSITCF